MERESIRGDSIPPQVDFSSIMRNAHLKNFDCSLVEDISKAALRSNIANFNRGGRSLEGAPG